MIRAYDDYGNVVDLVEWEQKIRVDEIRKFADKIKQHMIKYCHGRLEQQYCVMEVIDYMGKLMGEKDYSIDVETAIKGHDKKVRADAIEEFKDAILAQFCARCDQEPCEGGCVGSIQQCYAAAILVEVANDTAEELKEQK